MLGAHANTNNLVLHTPEGGGLPSWVHKSVLEATGGANPPKELKKKKKKQEILPEATGNVPTLTCGLWAVQVPKESTLPLRGFCTDAFSLEYDKDQEIFQSAHNILTDFLEHIKEDVEFETDYNMSKFPEVGRFLEDQGAPQTSLSIAMCPSRSKWGVGMGPASNAQKAAKLALALSLVLEVTPEQIQSCITYNPDFAYLCHYASIPGISLPCLPGGGGAVRGGPEPKKSKKSTDIGIPGLPESMASGTNQWCMVTVAKSSSIVQSGYPEFAPAIYWERSNQVFGNAHNILTDILGDDTKDVIFEHWPEWVGNEERNAYPEVSKHLQDLFGGDHCGFCFCKSPLLNTWGMGMAYGKKTRETASKLALSVALVMDKPLLLGTLMDAYPEFTTYLKKSGIFAQIQYLQAMSGQPVTKMPKPGKETDPVWKIGSNTKKAQKLLNAAVAAEEEAAAAPVPVVKAAPSFDSNMWGSGGSAASSAASAAPAIKIVGKPKSKPSFRFL